MTQQQGTPAPNNPDQQWTILKLLTWTTSYFETHLIEHPRADAELLLAHALGIRRIDLYLQHDKPLLPEELTRFRWMVKRRAQREPVAYILGAKEFWSMELVVTPKVLIPRPETECLVEAALDVLPESGPPVQILELGTGTGAISLALAKERPNHQYHALDRSPDAVALAKKNAEKHHLDQCITFSCGDWFSALHEGGAGFDLIVSNPPYIRSADIETLQLEIRHYEPIMALSGGKSGYDCLRHIIQTAPYFLKPGGWVIVEIGWDQGPGVVGLTDDVACYENVSVRQDYSGHDRVVQIHKKHAG